LEDVPLVIRIYTDEYMAIAHDPIAHKPITALKKKITLNFLCRSRCDWQWAIAFHTVLLVMTTKFKNV